MKVDKRRLGNKKDTVLGKGKDGKGKMIKIEKLRNRKKKSK